MKALRPITIAVLGSLLLGVAVTFAGTLTVPHMRDLRGTLIWFTTGLAAGLIVFVPIAAVEASRSRLARWLAPYSFRIQWYVSLAMAAAMGYIAASMRHKAVDGIAVLALPLVFLGAMTEVALSIIFRRDGQSDL